MRVRRVDQKKPPRRGRLKRAAKIAAGAVASVVVFAGAAVVSAVLHGGLPPSRRLLSRTATDLLAKSLKGKVEIPAIARLGPGGLALPVVEVKTPEGERALLARDVRIDASLFGLAASALKGVAGGSKIVIPLGNISIASLDVSLDKNPQDQKLELLRAFESRNPPPPDQPKGKPTRIAIDQLSIGHAWLHGRPSGAQLVDADIDALKAAIVQDGAEGFSLSAKPFSVKTRALEPYDPQGEIEASVFIPAEGVTLPRKLTAASRLLVGQVPVSLSASADGDTVDARVDIAQVTPEQLRSIVPTSPLREPARARVSVSGTLPSLDVTAAVGSGPGSATAMGHVTLEPFPTGEVALSVRDVDPRVAMDAPEGASIGAEMHASFRAPPEGPEADVDLVTFPLTWGGQLVPAVSTRAHLSKAGGAKGEAWVHEPGAQLHLRYDVAADGQAAVVDADGKSANLAAVPHVAGAARGAASFVAHAELRGKTLQARAQVQGQGLVASGNSVGGLTVKTELSGPLASLSTRTELEARGVRAGGQHLDRVRARAAGPIASPHVAVELFDPRFKLARVEADVATRGGVAVRNVNARLVTEEADLTARVAQIHAGGGRVEVRGVRLDSSAGQLSGDVAMGPDSLRADLEGQADLAQLGRIAGVYDVEEGRVALSVHVDSRGRDHRGQVRIEASDVQARQLSLINSLSASIDLAGREVRSKIAARAETRAMRTEVVGLDSDARATIDGKLLDPGTWKKAQADAHQVIYVDLDGVYAQELVKNTLTLNPSLPRAGGKVRAEIDVKKDPRAPYPDVALSLRTRDLVVQDSKLPYAGGGDEKRLEDLDLAVDAHVRNEDGFADRAYRGRVAVDASVRAGDKNGEWGSASVATALDPTRVLEALSQARQAGASADRAIARLKALPVAARVRVADRPIESWPDIIRPLGVTGNVSGEVVLSGTLGDPRLEATAQAKKLIASTGSSAPPIDALVRARLLPDRVELVAAVDEKDKRVLDLGAAVDVRAIDALWGVPARWQAGLAVRADGFRLESVPQIEAQGLSGKLSGEARMAGIGHDPEIKADMKLEGAALRETPIPLGIIQADLAPGRPSTVGLRLEQGAHDSVPAGSFEASAKVAMGFKGGLVPFLDKAKDQAILVRSKSFDLSPFSPLLQAQVGELAGTLDGEAKLSIKGHQGKVKADDLDLRGAFSWHDGKVGIPQIGQTFHKGTMQITVASQDDSMALSVRDLSLSAYTGRVTGWADAKVPVDALLGSSDGGPPEPLAVKARASMHIENNEKLELTYQGAPLGQASGNIDVDIRPTDKGLAVFVAAPNIVFDLPETKKRNVQPLTPDPDVGIVDHIDLAELAEEQQKAAEKSSLGEIVVRIGIGDQLETLINGAKDPPAGDLLIEREELAVRAKGRPVFVVDGETKASGEIRTSGGRVVVIGKPFFVERGVVRFAGDPANPELDVLARWDAPDGSQIKVQVSGTAQKPKVTLSSDPPRTESAVLNMILFGREDMTAPSDDQDTRQAGGGNNGGTAAAGVAASTMLNYLIDPIEVFGHRLETKVDTSGNQAKVGVATEIKPNLWAQINVATGRDPSRPNSDLTTVMLDWRFARRWTLRTTAGDRGSSALDLIWQKRF